MAIRDELGTRMKKYYEEIPKIKLMRRCPVVIRIDGCHFHTFTRGFQKPFDKVLMESMQQTMKYLCENIHGCVFGYTQSDEISLILVDYKKLNSEAWFDNEVQKLCSVSASMATLAFNKSFSEILLNLDPLINDYSVLEGYDSPEEIEEVEKQWEFANSFGLENKEQVLNYIGVYNESEIKGALFDSRCFNIPKEEVANLIYWRQLDAMRNSVNMVGFANFSKKKMHGKSTSKVKEMLCNVKRIDWNKGFPTDCKRGSCCIKDENGKWFIDKEIPIFKGEDRKYIEDLIFVGEE